MHTVGIIGGGFSGLMAAVHLTTSSQVPLQLYIVNTGNAFPRGVAYSTQAPWLLLNVRAQGMSAYPDKPLNFVEWLKMQPEYAGLPEEELRLAFIPRKTYGNYLDDIWKELNLRLLQQHKHRVSIINDTITGAEVIGNKVAFEEAFVGVRHVFQRVAMNHDDGRIHAALVGVTHFRPVHADLLRRLESDRLLQQAGQLGRRHLSHRGRLGLDDGLPDRTKSLALARRDQMQRSKLQKCQAGLDLALQLLALVTVDRVPLVDGQHHRAATFEDVAGDVRVLIGHALRRIQQQQHDMRAFDRLQRLDH